MMDLEQLIGSEIQWVRGMSFDQIIGNRPGGWLPSWARRYCTAEMKMLPIFLWWWNTIGEKCDMRIGFRFDEFMRMENFFNNSDPTNFSIPTKCDMRGARRQSHTSYNWRNCSFPMIRSGITKEDVSKYWINNGWMSASLFEERRQIEFPSISNCIGCFHKKPETLAAMADMHPDKFKWFIDQEQKGMGTWLDSKMTYQHIMTERFDIGREVIHEAHNNLATCDTGGCTD